MASFSILHIPTGRTEIFTEFALTEYQDNLSTKYNTTEVFGRMDPITTYQGTTRKISIGIRLQRPDKNQMSRLAAMQYPTYASKTNALTISRPPLVRVSLGDLLTEQLAALDGFSFAPQTGFSAADSPIIRCDGNKEIIDFKSVELKFNLSILHEAELGFDDKVLNWLGDSSFGPGELF